MKKEKKKKLYPMVRDDLKHFKNQSKIYNEDQEKDFWELLLAVSQAKLKYFENSVTLKKPE